MGFTRPSIEPPPVYEVKWSRPVLQEGFTPFPRRLMRCMNKLFRGDDAVRELQVVLAISDAKRLPPKNGGDARPPTLDFLAYNVGMQEQEFANWVRQLETKGMLIVRDNNKKNFDVDLSPLLSKIEVAASEDDFNDEDLNRY